MRKVVLIVAMLGVVGAVALGWAYSGRYNVAADAPHWNVTTRVLATHPRTLDGQPYDVTALAVMWSHLL